jgi:leucyl-tRNA synthetase
MKERYEAAEIEARWQRTWNERGSFHADLDKGPKYYVLEMFPYPSGKIHMGHVRNYAIGDVVARFKRAQGFQVIHPMGWDAFGLPAENAAIDHGIHPLKWTYDNIDHMRGELKRLGYSYEWDRELATCHPSYYRWEQLLFIKMLERDLAYRRTQLVNWCPDCATVLANEQVRDGKCDRCSTPIEMRELPGWYLRITRYAQELLDGLDVLEGKWDGRVVTSQREWIGRSEGVEVDFPLTHTVDGVETLRIFTTRPDTLYGVTFMSLAPEHPLALSLARGTEREDEVRAFVQRVRAEDKTRRTAEDYPKEGVFTGRTCRNPVNGDEVPIYVANFVLVEYGTGAIMAVPAHDQRDFELARQYGIPIKVVIDPSADVALDPATMEAAYVDDGVQVNSGSFDGMPNREAMDAIADMLESQSTGRRAVSYKLRDWSVARQRYWGCPIPVMTCDTCGIVPVNPEDLPVLLPEDVEITGKGGSPLAAHPTFPHAACPKCGAAARRETDTFDTFVESSWYMHRFLCSRCEDDILDRASLDAGMPVDQYIGGIEHATGHLNYTRFFHRVLRDLGYVKGDEPAARLLCQGMVCKETFSLDLGDGRIKWVPPEDVKTVDDTLVHTATGQEIVVGRSEKMSKSKLNVVAPAGIVDQFGADTVRFFMLSDSPPEADLHWSDQGVEGAHRYLLRLWHLVQSLADRVRGVAPYHGDGTDLGDAARSLRRVTHASLDRVTRDIEERFSFNTALARIREMTEGLRQAAERPEAEVPAAVLSETVRVLLIALAPFAPHITEELWERIGGEGILAESRWPAHDPAAVATETVTVVVQVNGKLRAKLEVAPTTPDADVEAAAMAHDLVVPHVRGKEIKKLIYLKGRLVNIVAK